MPELDKLMHIFYFGQRKYHMKVNLHNLQYLDFDDNLSGLITSQNLEAINFSGNNLLGYLPSTIGLYFPNLLGLHCTAAPNAPIIGTNLSGIIHGRSLSFSYQIIYSLALFRIQLVIADNSRFYPQDVIICNWIFHSTTEFLLFFDQLQILRVPGHRKQSIERRPFEFKRKFLCIS